MENEAIDIFRSGVHAVQADMLLERSRALSRLSTDTARPVRLVGAGKASLAMAGVLESRLGNRILDGVVVVPHGYSSHPPPEIDFPTRVHVMEASHPIPDEAGRSAALAALHLAQSSGEDDFLVVLISGGASALWPLYVEDISIDDAATLNKLLLESGADIIEINTVRKHVSRLGGGQLAQAASPATVLALIVSDVVGDDPSFIGSGPCSPDATTFLDAREILQKYGCWDNTPRSVQTRIADGVGGFVPETPGPEDAVFSHVDVEVVGTNQIAVDQAARYASNLGYEARVVSTGLTGQAKEVGPAIAREIMAAPPGSCLVWGGETTVTVTGTGKGGRNQELTLAAAIALDGFNRNVCVLSAGTDGYDGPTDAAGAWADGSTAARARDLGLVPERLLRNNDSYTFFDGLGQHIKTGPTHTNVMDLVVVMSGE